MKKIRIGLGRFYNGNMVRLFKGERVRLNLLLNDIEVRIEIGKDPIHILTPVTISPPQPIEKTETFRPSNRKDIVIPGPEKYPADIYIEIVATRNIDVEDELASRFNNKDKVAAGEVTRLANSYLNELRIALNFIAGLLGLRIHPELVKLPILEKEQLYIYREGTSYHFSTGFIVNVRKAAIITADKEGLQDLLKRIQTKKKDYNYEKGAEALGWMLRGWSAEDKVLQFVSYFTALECIVPKNDNPVATTFENEKEYVLAIVNKSVNSNERNVITDFIKKFSLPPRPLNECFKKWAKESGMEQWEGDWKAFKKYNATRNRLLHAGDVSCIENSTIEEKDVISLEEIAMRYLSYYLYGEASGILFYDK